MTEDMKISADPPMRSRIALRRTGHAINMMDAAMSVQPTTPMVYVPHDMRGRHRSSFFMRSPSCLKELTHERRLQRVDTGSDGSYRRKSTEERGRRDAYDGPNGDA